MQLANTYRTERKTHRETIKWSFQLKSSRPSSTPGSSNRQYANASSSTPPPREPLSLSNYIKMGTKKNMSKVFELCTDIDHFKVILDQHVQLVKLQSTGGDFDLLRRCWRKEFTLSHLRAGERLTSD
ncbi:hypothetical protein EYF80_000276 [Liparis tanakae]|uniref:Uncharacterized protein n=1 Tax=Liparis tanakae TaxID=230148 RepID=A0A4Z2JIN1_9TELE|nr:hypothetical protein EYF80_000276 [Liparis tanakae]